MLRRLKYVGHSFARAQTPAEVLAQLDAVVAPGGMRAFSVWRPYSLTEPREREAMTATMVYHAAPPEAEAALKDGFFRRGPSVMARYAAISPGPFTFGEAKRRLQPSGDDRWIFDTYRDHGVRDGLYCGFFPWVLVYAADQVLNPDLLTEETRLALNAAAGMAVDRMKQIAGKDKRAPRAELTPREVAVLGHLSDGLLVAEVADVLSLSEETIKTFVARAARKLGARNQAHALVLAVRRRLI